MSEHEAAVKLAEFLTSPDSYSRKSPLQNRVQVEIQALAARIAGEVVASLPELEEIIRRRTSDLIYKAMHDDTALNATVVQAVAAALMKSKEED